MLLAAVELSSLVALVLGVLGLGGLIFTALRYNRDDTTAILGQQNTIVGEMKTLNEELRLARDECREEVARLRAER